MYKLVSHNLWKHIETLAKHAHNKRVAVAYVSNSDKIQFGERDLLICDASNQAIQAGQTSAAVLGKVYESGAELYSLRGLHAKLFYLGGTAVIGSPNISASSANSLIEAALITDQPQVVLQTLDLIEHLKSQSQLIRQSFLRRIECIPVNRVFDPGVRRIVTTGKQNRSPNHRTWLIGSYGYNETNTEHSRMLDEGIKEAQQYTTRSSSDAGWIKLGLRSKYSRLARQNDMIIYTWRESRDVEEPTCVYRPAPVLLRKQFDGFVGIYTEMYKDAEKTTLSWHQFLKLAEWAGLRLPIARDTERELTQEQANTLFDLWDTV